MRIMGFTEHWPKLQRPIHTTFRLPQKDADRGRDWAEGEVVQEFYRPRSKSREFIQLAKIIKKEPKLFQQITLAEAIEDGFTNLIWMYDWLRTAHPSWDATKPINKLTLEVVRQ